ncbi:MAG: topoisomerase [Bacteroidia bacterium]|nr:topoisomerase [Bacteroidia bacterium]
MAKRDPELTARNKAIRELSRELKVLEPDVLDLTGFDNVHSLHGKIGGKFDQFIDIKNEVIHSPDHFISLWLEGYKNELINLGSSIYESNLHETYRLLRTIPVFKDYLFIFLRRTYLRNYDALSKKRPKVEDAEMYIGQNNANYGILVTPRFNNGQWENDKSEIRHFKKKYWSIGHVLETGLVVPGKEDQINFVDLEEYLKFFVHVLVRNSGSKYEMEIAELYREYVLSHEDPESIPLLIPEFRYEGVDVIHKYRLDFTIIEPNNLNKIGFELSPWSTHGKITGTKNKTQKSINEIAKSNFEREMDKHKSYFKKHGVFTLIYTDNDLENVDAVFEDMKKYLQPQTSGQQLKLHMFEDFFNKDFVNASEGAEG